MSQPAVNQPGSKAYLHTLPKTWWLKRWAYTRFMIREITAVFVAAYVVELVILISRLADGPEATAAFFESLSAPGWVLFHVVSLGFVLYHSITWFNLSPKVFVVYMFEEKVPAWLVAGSNYVGWVVLSVIVAWYLLKT